ncbi:hypothetical protein INT47_012151 [Mucor saturninus]|uniref:OTU domain-containing protein n=1 Tax=Mucor saturninus TaxID=64648 RepID=A0A8H7UNW3_9FUNG|nr:hypothetical protein INT47_012151 [Mucor saturninus]
MKLPCRHIIYKEEYDQVFSIQTDSNGWDSLVIRKNVVIPLSSVDARWIVGELALSNNSTPLESVHLLLSSVYTETNATNTILHKLGRAIEEIPFEHVRKEKLDVISQMVDNINANLDAKVLQPLKKKELVVSSQKIAKTGRILSQGEAVKAKVKKVKKPKPATIKKLKQAKFDDNTIIDDNIKHFRGLLSICMPEFMLKHVASVEKVLGDGNCGFRSIAASMGRDEVIKVALSLGVELSGDFEQDEDYYMDLLLCWFRFGILVTFGIDKSRCNGRMRERQMDDNGSYRFSHC